LSLTPGIGGVTTRKLLERFGDVGSNFETSHEEIAAVPRISLSISQQLLNSPIDQISVEIFSLIL
jgi:excinuclease UvrABC nuclease subunit